MQIYTVKNDAGPDLRFNGVVIADKPDHGYLYGLRYMRIYFTKAGKYVCELQTCHILKDTPFKFRALVTDDTKAVAKFFGFGKDAKELYLEAGIECVELVK